MKTVFVILLTLHLLIHLIGFLQAFDLAKLPESTKPISKTQGIFWLVTGLLFIPAIILYIQNNPIWTVLATPIVIMSQVLLVMNWKDAKFGTIINLIIITVAIIHFTGWQLYNF